MKETIYRFVLAFCGEDQGVGILQGMSDTPLPLNVHDELVAMFDSLVVPPRLCTPDDSPIVCWFTEAGLQKFGEAVNCLIYELEQYDWQVMVMSLELAPDNMHGVQKGWALYSDEYQICFSAADILEVTPWEFREIARVEPECEEHFIYCGGNDR